jgi:1-acyl-sn-glycerol-3-phosphate acyltransferase
MRSLVFALAYWTLSIGYGILALLSSLLPGRGPVRRVIRRYTRHMVQAMRLFAGIRLDVRGREHLLDRPVIYACKHQSWGDGFCIYAQFDDLAFVTGDHLEKYPFMGTLLHKLGAIVVNTCGGHEAHKAFAGRATEAAQDHRSILIYPEGHLNAPGTYRRYRAGVWHMMRDYDMPVIPVATNLGLFWQEHTFRKRPGTAVLEFLEPIMPGMEKQAFLDLLRDRIETRSQHLISEATGQPFTPSIRSDQGLSTPAT